MLPMPPAENTMEALDRLTEGCAMTRQQLLKKYELLPTSARRRVDALVTSLSQGAARTSGSRRKGDQTAPLANEPFVGMWSDRTDMADSTKWVKSLRRRQWSHRSG
jgi:hypothetical protein